MAGLDQEAQALKHALKGRGFVRRDRSGKGLFATDAARLNPDGWQSLQHELAAAGYLITAESGLAFISWDYPKSLAFCQALYVPGGWERGEDSLAGFCRILFRQQAAFTPDMLPSFHRCLLLWDAGEAQALRQQAEAALADALRLRALYPAYFLPLLLSLSERSAP